MKTSTRFLKTGLLTFLAGSASLLLSNPAAHAGAAELAALKTHLAVDITQATSAQLFLAFRQTIGDTKYNSTAKYGVVAGEALKAAGANATDAGAYFAQMLSTDQTAPVPQAYAAANVFVSLAAKTAGTGTGLNVTQIADLTSGLITAKGEDPKAFATAAAKAAANKPGAGAIIGGGASLLANDAAKIDYANASIIDTKLKLGALDIIHYVAAEVNDSANYAVSVANANSNYKIALTVAAGAIAGDPTNAGNIVRNLFGQPLTNDTTGANVPATTAPTANVLSAIVKGASTLAKSASAVADIEEIAKIGNAFGRAIATPSANPLKGQVLLSKAASVVKTLATAVMTKPLTDRFGIIPQNTIANKQDELAEVAAYVLGGLIGSPELGYVAPPSSASKIAAANKKAATTILALITNVTSVKPKILTQKINGVSTKVPQGPAQDTFAVDVAASIALTVKNSSLSADIKMAVHDLLLLTDSRGNPTTANKINKTAGAQIIIALNDVYSGTNTGRFEDGNVAIGLVSDPETDSHPFNTVAGQS